MLEALCHKENCFLTLTYTDEKLPSLIGSVTGEPLATLRPKDLQDWLKRFREALRPLSVRFYAVGEYGNESDRPHYHVCVFGVRGCVRARTRRALGSSRPDWENCCDFCRVVGRTWGLGAVDVGTLTLQSAAYVAEYTVKKMNKSDQRLLGRYPEFSRQSRRPGIGSDAMWQLASDLMNYELDQRPDVPATLNHGKRELPLGRYLRMKLRERIGKEGKAPNETLQALEEKLRPVREAAFHASRPLWQAIAEAGAQGALNQATRTNIMKGKRSL